jgi:hypothetical protein
METTETRLISAVLFTYGNLIAGVTSWLLARRLFAQSASQRRLLAAIAGFPVVVVIALAAAAVLERVTIGTTCGLLTAAMITLVATDRDLVRLLRSRVVAPERLVESEPYALPMGIGLCLLFGGPVAATALLGATPFSNDDLAYHATVVAEWATSRGIVLPHFNPQAYWPLGGELLSLWFALPFGADTFASLSGLYWLLLLVSVVWALGEIRGHTRETRLLTCAAILASSVVTRQASTFAAVDLAGPTAMLAAVAIAARTSADSLGPRVGEACFSGLLAGLAAGSKVSFVPLALFLVVWLVARGWMLGTRRRIVATALAFAGGALLTGGYWYARNVLLTGNPLFPAQIGPWDGPLDRASQQRTTLIAWILADPFNWRQWRFIVQSHLVWPLGPALLALVGYVAAVLSRRTAYDFDSDLRRLLLITGLFFLALYPWMPYSGTDDGPDAPLRISLRFLIFPFCVGVVLFEDLIDVSSTQRVFWRTAAVLMLVTAWQRPPWGMPVALVLAIAAIGAWRLGWAVLRTHPTRVGVGTAALMFTGALVVCWLPVKQRLTAAELYGTAGDVGPAWRALESLPSGARVAWFGVESWRVYPYWGRAWQLRPIRVLADGSAYRPLHERWRERHFQWGEHNPSAALPQPSRLVGALTGNGIQYVVVSKWRGRPWPPQQDALAASGQAQIVWQDAYSVIWKLGRHDMERKGAPGVSQKKSCTSGAAL